MITKEKRGASTVIHVDGQLLAAGLTELKRALEPEDRAICLDLEHLISLDAEGIDAIRKMASQGIRVIKASPYISLLLQAPRKPNNKPIGQGRAS